MAKHELEITVNECGRGPVLLDGEPLNVDSVIIDAGCGRLTKATVRLVNVAVSFKGPAEVAADMTTTKDEHRVERSL